MSAWIFIAAAMLSFGRLASGHRHSGAPWLDSREADAVHVGMNGGMAVMIAMPRLDAVWLYALFGVMLIALGMGLAIQAASRSRSARIGATVYHALAVAAMIWAVHLMGGAMTDGMMRRDAATPRWPTQVSLPLFAAFVFAADAAATAIMVAFFPDFIERTLAGTPAAAPVRSVGKCRPLIVAAFPHVIMDVGMAAMLATAS